MRIFIAKYWRDLLILIPIIALASYLRLYQIRGYQMFLGDQGRDALIVSHIITQQKLPFIGPNASVGGFFLGPLYYYLMAPAMFFANLDPIGPAIQVAVFSILTTILVYYYMKRYVCLAGAIVSSSIYAVSVLVVEYSRSSWNPNVLPFFIMLLIFAWTKILAHDTKHTLRYFAVIGLMLGSIVQLHYAALIMVFVSVALYLWYLLFDWSQHNSLRISRYLLEIVVMLIFITLTLLPFIGFEIKNGYPNTCGVFNATFGNSSLKTFLPFSSIYGYCVDTYPMSVKASDDIFNNQGSPVAFILKDVSHRLFLRLVAGGDDDFYLMPFIYFTLCIAALYAFYRILSLFIHYIRNTSAKTTTRAYLKGFLAESSYQKFTAVFIILLTWWILGIGWWGLYKKSIYDYYFSYMYPLPIITFGIACALIFHMYSRRVLRANYFIRVGKLALWGFVGLIVYANLLKLSTIFPGMQVQRTEWATDSIIKMLGAGPYNFALIAEGNSDHAYRFFLERKGFTPVAIDKEVTDQLIVLCEIDTSKKPCEPEGNSLWEVAGFGPAKIVGQSTAIGYPLYRLQHIEGEQWRIGKAAQKGN